MNVYFLKPLMKDGPVDFVRALRQAWLAHRIRRVSLCLERERSLHHEHMVQLRAQWDALQLRQVQLSARAMQPRNAQP